jgi:hypothetical protein
MADKRTGDVLFPLGRVVATPGALEALAEAGQEPVDFLDRHACGNWGVVPEEDWALNDEALRQGLRLLSSYGLASGQKALDHHGGGSLGDHAAAA